MPWLDRDTAVKPAARRPYFKIWFWVLIVDLIGLTIWGKLPPTGVNAYIGFVFSILFLALFALLPVISKMERNGGAK